MRNMNKIILAAFVLLIIGIVYFKKSDSSAKQIEIAADIYCATFQARDESGLGKPIDVLRPRIMTTEDMESNGQQFQQTIITKMMPLMQKYSWDSGKLGQETEKADELMTKKSFREKVFNVLRKRGTCHAEYLK